ncbi:Uncharacterised protein [Mycolicibacterium flavescens]|nr:Uncharacterised protein [Mycolicibacterium flavescens]
MLATGIHAQPGVYALLLGSGVSRSAGINTGWEIVQHLVQKAAAAENPDDATSQELAAADPETWWIEHGDGEPLGYSSLLAAIAPTSAARQGLLAEYFVPTDEDRQEGRKLPTAGHEAIAELVKGGWVKVILTTNFDRLMEQALEAANVAYHVISRPEAAAAATPLAHSPATVVKLHGDWADLESRNTIEELERYPDEWVTLLTQVFNEYGLLISGWSAEWDKELVRVLESTTRRYPLYWDSRSSNSPVAKELLKQHGGQVVTARDADELFASLSSSVDALTQLAEPPLTTAMSIARLKRALPDPLRRIELRDLIRDSARLVNERAIAKPLKNEDLASIDAHLDYLLESTKPLLALLINGVRYDDGTNTSRWVEALQLLLDRPMKLRPQMVQASEPFRNYPALLALRAASIEAVAQGRDDVMIALLTTPHWDDPFHPGRSTVAADVLHILNVIDNSIADALPRWEGSGWAYPASHFLTDVLVGVAVENDVDHSRYVNICEDVEYRTGFVQYLLPSADRRYRHNPAAGNFVHDYRWKPVGDDWENTAPESELRFREHISRTGFDAWAALLDGRDVVNEIEDYRSVLRNYKKFS